MNQRINLRHELEERQVEINQTRVLNQALDILRGEAYAEIGISKRLTRGESHESSARDWIVRLDDRKCFDLSIIEQIAIKYRLRFLEGERFKGDVPPSAIRKIKRIESAHGIQFLGFKILAPSERFRLKDSRKDPILFAELPNGQYYFVYQWGDDMKSYEYLLKYPFRHIGALAASSSVLGFLVAFLVPSQFEAHYAEFFYRFFMFSMTTCMFMTLAIIVAIMFAKDFSENIWNSRYL
jgi:hypothetical protein